MAAENLVGNLPNKSFGEYQRPLPRDFELASDGDVSWKDETGTLSWDKMPVLPSGVFTSFDSSVVAVDQAIYIGNGDTSSVQAAWGSIGRYDWTRYTSDTSVWSSITPTEGQLCYDTSANVWYTYDSSSTGWKKSSNSVGSVGTSKWYKYSLVYSDFTATITGENLALTTIPANSQIQRVRIKHSASFTGGSVSAATISVNDGTLYSTAFNVFQAPLNTRGLDNSYGSNSYVNNVEGFTVYAFLTLTGDNINNLTAGAVDIYFEVITFE